MAESKKIQTDKRPFEGEWVKLGDVCNISSGGTPKRSISEYWHHGTIPWIKISDIKHKHVSDAEEYITNAGLSHSAAKMFEPGTILFSIFASIGAVGILDMPAATNQAIAGLKIKNDVIEIDYLYHWLKGQETVTKNAARGVAQSNINLSILRNMMIPIPSRTIQKSIADQFNMIDRQIDNAKYLSTALDSLVKCRFVEMFGDPCANSASKLPKQTIKEFCELRIGPFGSVLHKEDYIVGGHPLVNPSHMIAGKIKPDANLTIDEAKYSEMKSYHLRIGDIVLGRRGEIGRCAVVQEEGMVCGTGSMILRPNTKLCRSDYLQRIVSFPSFAQLLEKAAVGVTMKNLNTAIVGNAAVTLPPLALQHEFANFVTHIDKLRFDVQQQIEKLETLKQSLMQEYFG